MRFVGERLRLLVVCEIFFFCELCRGFVCGKCIFFR